MFKDAFNRLMSAIFLTFLLLVTQKMSETPSKSVFVDLPNSLTPITEIQFSRKIITLAKNVISH